MELNELNLPDMNLDEFDFDELLDIDFSAFENQPQESSEKLNSTTSLFDFPKADDLPIPGSNSDIISTNSHNNSIRTSTKHTRDDLRNYLEDNVSNPFTSFGEYEDKDILKVMRLGSLDRIIASSVVARRSSSDVLISPIKSIQSSSVKIDHEENIRKVVEKFLKALKNSDMNGLAQIISENFEDSCFVSTPDLTDPAIRKSRVMMYFGLVFETYPDGLWKFQTQTLNMNSMSVVYTFTGTRVFDQTIDSLFKYINMHIMKKIEDVEDRKDQNDFDFVASHMSEYVRLPAAISQLSPQASVDHHTIQTVINSNISNSNNNYHHPYSNYHHHHHQDHPNSTSTITSVQNNHSSVGDDGIIRVNSFSKISVSSIPLNRLSISSVSSIHSGSFKEETSSNNNSTNSINNNNNNNSTSTSSTPRVESSLLSVTTTNTTTTVADPSIREIANKAIKQGITKHHRRMDIVFNEMDQVIRIIIC